MDLNHAHGDLSDKHMDFSNTWVLMTHIPILADTDSGFHQHNSHVTPGSWGLLSGESTWLATWLARKYQFPEKHKKTFPCHLQ
jgi:hypothetical protein